MPASACQGQSRMIGDGAAENEFRPAGRAVDDAPIAADGAFERALPGLIERLDDVDAEFSRFARVSVSMIARAWSQGDGRAPSRMRPALGQPNSPITISLPGIAAATLLADGDDMGGRAPSRDREILPIRQHVDGDEIDRALHVGIAQPILPDVGIGDRHRHLRLDLADDRHEIGRRHLPAQQHLVADDRWR